MIPLAPDQLPDAVQAVALLADQLKVLALPLAMLLGLLESVTAGAGCETDTVTDCDALLPPEPEQVRV